VAKMVLRLLVEAARRVLVLARDRSGRIGEGRSFQRRLLYLGRHVIVSPDILLGSGGRHEVERKQLAYHLRLGSDYLEEHKGRCSLDKIT
jgi:hypothetical protein